MKRTLLLASLCLAVAWPAVGQGRGISVEPASQAYVEAEPRKVVTAAFEITNISADGLELASHVDLPAGWTLVANEPNLSLSLSQSEVGLVSFLIPQAAPAGRYRVRYRMEAVDDPSTADSSAIDLYVLPVTRLEVRLLESRDRVVAGERYRARFAVTNLGNTGLSVMLALTHTAHLSFELKPGDVHLEPSETAAVEVTAVTDPDVRWPVRGALTLTATIPGHVEPSARASAFVKVVPRVTRSEDPYDRIPSTVGFRHVYEKNECKRSAFQGEISGMGRTDDEGRSELAFLWRGPDVGQNRILGSREEFFIAYTREHFNATVGDQGYSVSPLLENHHFARGVKSELGIGRLRGGVYHFDTRWGEPQESQTGIFADYDIGRDNHIGVNYLWKRKGSQSDIVGLETRLETMANTALEAEYAVGLGTTGPAGACRIRCGGLHEHVSYLLRYIRAEPGFEGYFNNMDFVSTSVGLDAGCGLRFDIGFKQERRNLDLDTLLFSAPIDRAYELRAAYRHTSGLDAALLTRIQRYDDRLPRPHFGCAEQSIRSSLGQHFQAWDYHASFETGKHRDRITGNSSRLARYAVSVSVRPSKRHRYRGYVFYDNEAHPAGGAESRITSGLSASFTVRPGSSVDLDARCEDSGTGPAQGRTILEIALNQSLGSLGSLSLRGYYSTHADQDISDHLAFMAEYGIPFGLPVGKKQTVGTVRGRVYDEETREPVVGALLMLNGATAVTDDLGEFTFPSIPKGMHQLNLEIASVGLDMVTRDEMPMAVEVQGGKTTLAGIAVVRGCTLQGRAVLYATDSRGSVTLPGRDLGTPKAAGGLAEALVEITDGSETRRTMTDDRGEFRFDELRPGTWRVSISDRDIPAYHRIEAEASTVELLPGETEQATLRVLPVARPIRIMQEGLPLIEDPSRGG